MKFRSRVVTLLGCCLLGVSPLTAFPSDETDQSGGERCIFLSRVADTDVVDDFNILFYMRGGTIYRNILPHRCIGLKNEDTFMYRTSISQLCDLDIITVLYDHGFGFTPGPSCGLGRFLPIAEDEAEALKESPPRAIPAEELPTAKPENIENNG